MKNVIVETTVYNVEVDVDPEDVLDQLDPSDIEDYLEDKHTLSPSKLGEWDYNTLVDSYYHGDFDLKLFLRKLKMSDLVTALESKSFCRPKN